MDVSGGASTFAERNIASRRNRCRSEVDTVAFVSKSREAARVECWAARQIKNPCLLPGEQHLVDPAHRCVNLLKWATRGVAVLSQMLCEYPLAESQVVARGHRR